MSLRPDPRDCADAIKRADLQQGAYFSELGGVKIGVALSGGGWRAMETAAYTLHTLKATPLNDKASTGVSALDCVSLIAGLSGGAWACVLGGMTDGGDNCFYHAPEGKGAKNPWDPNHASTGGDTAALLKRLEAIFAKENVEVAREAPSGTRSWWHLITGPWEFFSTKVFHSEDPFLIMMANAIMRNRDRPYLENYATVLGSQFLGARADFAQLKQSPTLPTFVVAAISKRSGGGHDWYQIDAVSRRHEPVPGALCHADAAKPHEDLPLNRVRVRTSNSDAAAMQPFSPSRLMATCGSALEDWQRRISFVLDSLQFSAHVHATQKHGGDPHFVTALYDAGVSVNVPIALLRNTGVNVAFIVDASYTGEEIKGCDELAKAIELGHWHPRVPRDGNQGDFTKKCVRKPWDKDECARVFFPSEATQKVDPVLIYIRGLTEMSTYRMDRGPAEIKNHFNLMEKRVRVAITALNEVVSTSDFFGGRCFKSYNFAFVGAPVEPVIGAHGFGLHSVAMLGMALGDDGGGRIRLFGAGRDDGGAGGGFEAAALGTNLFFGGLQPHVEPQRAPSPDQPEPEVPWSRFARFPRHVLERIEAFRATLSKDRGNTIVAQLRAEALDKCMRQSAVAEMDNQAILGDTLTSTLQYQAFAWVEATISALLRGEIVIPSGSRADDPEFALLVIMMLLGHPAIAAAQAAERENVIRFITAVRSQFAGAQDGSIDAVVSWCREAPTL